MTNQMIMLKKALLGALKKERRAREAWISIACDGRRVHEDLIIDDVPEKYNLHEYFTDKHYADALNDLIERLQGLEVDLSWTVWRLENPQSPRPRSIDILWTICKDDDQLWEAYCELGETGSYLMLNGETNHHKKERA